ncbi:MAG TPA: hypothetical protein VNQ90_09665 [Chthoniobacteraceae bacterium]|nr:hypothetical protein [Chthoniobacteraceae bacterium]
MKRSLLLLLATGLCATSLAAKVPPSKSAAADPVVLRDAKSDAFLKGRFRIGFYLYLWGWEQGKNREIRDVDRAIHQMADMGFNYVYIAGAADNELWQDVLKICLERRIAIVAQLGGGAYLTMSSNIEKQAAIASDFITKYKDHPAVISFLIKEEPNLAFLPRIQEYYTKVLEKIPDAPLYLLHNQLASARAEQPPYPKYTGTDRYPFWWEFGLNNNRASPASAFKWYHTQIDAYYQLAAERGQNFEVVLTDWVQQLERDKDQLINSIYPKTADEKARQAVVDRLLRLADAGNHGVERGKDGNIHIWKYYRPPANAMAAQAWLAVMEGADALSVYTWSQARQRETSRTSGTLGWNGEALPSTLEYAQFAREIAPFGRLLRGISKETTPILNEPEGHEEVITEAPRNPPIAVNDDNTVWRSFTIPGFKGKIIILVNTKIGEWSEGRSPYRLTENDLFRIDHEGNLVDYVPHYLPRSVNTRILTRETEVINLSTGRELTQGEAHDVAVNIPPGRGVILFLAPKGSDEKQRLLETFNLSGDPLAVR